jgi:hypothetical protein
LRDAARKRDNKRDLACGGLPVGGHQHGHPYNATAVKAADLGIVVNSRP